MDIRPTEEKIAEERYDAKSRVDHARIASQFGRLKNGHKSSHSDGGGAERDAWRRQTIRDIGRSKKANARHQRRKRQVEQSLVDLQAQIRVASGETGASPAMVANARKALEAKVDRVMQENPELTEEQAVEVVFARAAGVA